MNNDYHMDGHKLFWHLDRVVAWQAGEPIVPIYIEISPVSFCNHRCVFCGIDFAQNERLILDAELLSRRLLEMGQLGVKSIMFAGEGEPLLHQDLPRIVSHAKRAGIDVSITTNGSTGSRALWEHLVPDLSWVRFSMDAGSADVYAKVHKVGKDMFATTVANIKEAVNVKIQGGHKTTIGVQFLLLPENLNDLERAIELYSGIGVDYISFKPYSEHPQMLNKSDFHYTNEMLNEVEKLVIASQPGKNTRLIYRKTASEAYRDGKLGFSHCCALPFWGYISSGGDFYTCSVFLNDDRFKAGNLYLTSMKDIFFGKQRVDSIHYAMTQLKIGEECRVNCRMARINEFLEMLKDTPEHYNFI